MTKMLLINRAKCTGCRLCELVCSFHHAGVFKPSASRIKIKLDTKEGIATPLVCLQCETCPCIEVCGEGAISKNEETAVVEIDKSKCTKCKECLFTCPYGGINYDQELDEVIVCDQCGGEPECVKVCFPKAIEWVDISSVPVDRKYGCKFLEGAGDFAY